MLILGSPTATSNWWIIICIVPTNDVFNGIIFSSSRPPHPFLSINTSAPSASGVYPSLTSSAPRRSGEGKSSSLVTPRDRRSAFRTACTSICRFSVRVPTPTRWWCYRHRTRVSTTSCYWLLLLEAKKTTPFSEKRKFDISRNVRTWHLFVRRRRSSLLSPVSRTSTSNHHRSLNQRFFDGRAPFRRGNELRQTLRSAGSFSCISAHGRFCALVN